MRGLVANVSHDLKTPLTSILGFSQALRDGGASDDAEVRRMGGVIHDEAARLSTRLNDLLLLSELESGEALLQRAEVDLKKLVESAVDRIEPEATARHVRLHTQLDGEVTVSADGAKLERAIENLLDNARKYTPERGVLRTRLYRENGHACIEVANTAPDIAEDELPRLFERFYRRDRARAQGGGSGLGLSIARELVELHGGTLDAALRDGQLVLTVRLAANTTPA
jgi:signal transduction histidine kinase